MGTRISTFKLPARLATPREISKQKQKEEPAAQRVMALWENGFCKAAAIDALASLQLAPIERPANEPSMPPDVVQISNEVLGTLHAQFVAFYAYLDEQRALIEVEADEEQAFFDHVAAEIHLRKTGTVPDKKAKVLNDPAYLAAEQRAYVAKARAKLLKARTAGYERCAAALSREMTRRGLIPREH